MTSAKFLWLLKDFVPEYHYAMFGCNWTTNKGETEGGTMCPPGYMVPKDPSLNRVNSLVLTWERNFEVKFGTFSVLVFQIGVFESYLDIYLF